MVLDLNKKTYLVVTGASRGIGKTMAIEVSKELKAGSVIILMARNKDDLNKTKASIEANRQDLKVMVYVVNLSKTDADELHKLLTHALLQFKEKISSFERAFIIHNAGTVGDVSKKAIDVPDTVIWTEYYHTNVFSTIALNVAFFSMFAFVPKLVVNITSKCALEPFVSMSFYCSAKAAREMYFSVLAAEEKDTDTLVLNYAPGAIDTDMTAYVQDATINKDLHDSFKSQRDTNTMLSTEQTTKKFLNILKEQKFKSGDHVDYWD